MSNYKHVISTKSSGFVINQDTFCPMKVLDIKLAIQSECQHDGRSWSDESVQIAEQDLYDEIMLELAEVVKKHIEDTKPFACHVFK